jgi:hypothetical protein
MAMATAMAPWWRRLDPFWLGAGGFLTLFGANELIAYATSPVPRWLGGPLVVVGECVAVVVGLAVMYGLGVREPLVETAPAETDASEEASLPERATSKSPTAPQKSASKKRRKSAAEALPPLRGSGTSWPWPRSSTNSKP